MYTIDSNNDGSFLFKCVIRPGQCDSELLSQHEQRQDPETEAAKWNPAIIKTCGFLTVFLL